MKERYWGQQFCQMERDISVRPTEVTWPVKVDHLELVVPNGPNRNGPFYLISNWNFRNFGLSALGVQGHAQLPKENDEILGPRICGLRYSHGQLKSVLFWDSKEAFPSSGGAVIDCKPNKRGCKCVQKKVASVLGFLAPCFRCTWQFQLRGVRPKLDFCHYVVRGGGEVLFTIFFDRGSPAPFLTVPMVGFLSYASYIAIKVWFSNCTVGSYV